MGSDYIRTAPARRAIGPCAVVRHALRNALLPVVFRAGVQLRPKVGARITPKAFFGDSTGWGGWRCQSILGLRIPTFSC